VTRAERIAAGHALLMAAIPANYGADYVRALAAQTACCSAAFTRYLRGDELDVKGALAEAGVTQ